MIRHRSNPRFPSDHEPPPPTSSSPTVRDDLIRIQSKLFQRRMSQYGLNQLNNNNINNSTRSIRSSASSRRSIFSSSTLSSLSSRFLNIRDSGLTSLEGEQQQLPPRRKRQSSSRRNNAKTQQPQRLVYIRDEAYAWLPAIVIDRPSSKSLQKKSSMKVRIALPDDWYDTTTPAEESITSSLPPLADKEERTIKLSDYPGEELPVANVIAEEQGGRLSASGLFGKLSACGFSIMAKADLADLPYLHEAAMLYNLKYMNARREPYLRVGDIIVATNPFTWIDGLYSTDRQWEYSDHYIWSQPPPSHPIHPDDDDLDEPSSAINNTLSTKYNKLRPTPHIYETSSLAYHGLMYENQHQAILVTGESGAGKTETVKLIMSHLAHIGASSPIGGSDDENDTDLHPSSSVKSASSSIIQVVLQSHPVFEAFGNAMTLRNDNSSRFGRLTQLQFSSLRSNDPTSPIILAGSYAETYLLEKSRVVGHDVGERTYHIFYQLFRADEGFKGEVGLMGKKMEDFKYLRPGGHMDNGDTASASKMAYLEGMEDDESWNRTVAALANFGIESDLLYDLARALVGILLFGNLTFESDEATHSGTIISSKESLAELSQVLKVEEDRVVKAFTKRTTRTVREKRNGVS